MELNRIYDKLEAIDTKLNDHLIAEASWQGEVNTKLDALMKAKEQKDSKPGLLSNIKVIAGIALVSGAIAHGPTGIAVLFSLLTGTGH